MPARSIPELKAKFQLIIRFGPYPTMEDLGRKHFDRSPKTLHGWAGSDERRPIDTVPEDAYPKFLMLLAAMLPDLGSEHHERLLQSPASALALALSRKGSGSLAELLEAQAVPARIALLRPGDHGLIDFVRKDEPAEVAVRLGEFFRLQAPSRYDCPYSIFLQHSGSGWGCAFPEPDADEGLLHVPGKYDASGDPGFMSEDKEAGFHSFYMILSPEPFSPVLAATFKDGHALDRATLDLLHDHCSRLSNRPHAIYRLTVRFE